ncbi:MAG: ATP-binding protein [Actinobacteria bacterium]|nr:ATP-binding protein [Actinomycetota bacterium]
MGAVTVRVPAVAAYLGLLRTAVGGFAARDRLTLDQIEDLRMAVEEAALALLRHSRDDHIALQVRSTDRGVEARLDTGAPDGAVVIDETSFSHAILRALADELRVEDEGGRTAVVLAKHRMADGGARRGRP